MKKIFAFLMAVCLTVSFASCSGTSSSGKALKTGMGIVTGMSGSDASEDGDGAAQVDSTVAVVLLDANGKIVDCKIDVAQNKMAFTAEGAVLDADKTFQTKMELKEAYDMKKASPIGKEWYEQATAFAEYVVGKTAAEVEGIAVDEKNHPTDEALTAGCTMAIGDMIKAVSKACANAVEAGAKEGDKLGLAVTTNMASSADADADGDGKCAAYSTYAGVTVGSDGKITSCVADATQGVISFDTKGVITSDLSAEVQTKYEKKEAYDMKKASPIGKEWYEQCDAFCAYVVGKTADEVSGIAVDEKTHPTDEALTAGCTMAIGDLKVAAATAVSYAD